MTNWALGAARLRAREVWSWASTGVRGQTAAPPAHVDAPPLRARILAGNTAIGARGGVLRPLGWWWQRLSAANRAAIVLLGAAVLYRLALILNGWPAPDSDEAVIGLMARHILHNGERPVFFWGQEYMGAFEAYFAAGVFALFGDSALTLHISVLLLTMGFLAAMYALARAAFGPVVGVLTLAWLTFGPPMGVLRQLMATGGYQELLMCGSLVLLGVWLRLREPDSLPRSRGAWVRCLLTYGAIGLVGGLGLWSDLLIVPVLLVGVVALTLVRTREILHIGGVVLVLAFCVGAWPYIDYNLTHDNASYRQVVRQSRPAGHERDLPTLDQWRNQAGATLAVGLPAILGSPHVCVSQGNVWATYPPAEVDIITTPNSLCNAANTALSAAVIALYLYIAWQLLLAVWLWALTLPAQVRTWHDWLLKLCESSARADESDEGTGARGTAQTQGARSISRYRLATDLGQSRPAPNGTAQERTSRAEVRAMLWLRAMMLGVGAMTLVGYTSSVDAQRYQFTSARYLLPLYLTAPLLFGCLWGFSQPFALALAARSRRRGLAGRVWLSKSVRSRRSMVATVALAIMLALSLGGGTLTFAHATTSGEFALPVPPEDTRLEAFLSVHRITSFYADYWTCYRLAFESGEHLTCAVRGQYGEPGLELINNRYDPYVRALAATPHPAYILPAGTVEDRGFVAEASAQHLSTAGYVRTTLDGYAIYYHAA